ncbi:MAG: phage/plasmid primase, P4 family [Gordonia sp. (in: high G+C Gram-positive bacteria)]
MNDSTNAADDPTAPKDDASSGAPRAASSDAANARDAFRKARFEAALEEGLDHADASMQADLDTDLWVSRQEEEAAAAAYGTGDDLPTYSELTAAGTPIARTLETISARECERYLHPKRLGRLRGLDPYEVIDVLVNRINQRIIAQNEAVKVGKLSGSKIALIKRLDFAEVARVVSELGEVRLISSSKGAVDPQRRVLAVYDDDPESPTYGIYQTDSEVIRSRIERYCPNLTTKGYAEIVAAMRSGSRVRRVCRGTDRDLLACNNGIVRYRAGKPPKLMPFSPEHVFLAKIAVDYDPNAELVRFDNPKGCTEGHDDPDDCTDACLTWDVESWMTSLMAADPANPTPEELDMTELLWEITGAVVRPYVSWNKAAFFYSTQGNNGKGTLVSLMRNLVGAGGYASIPLSDFSKEFMLEPLTRSSAILVDENDVGTYVDKAANFKAVVTNDVIAIRGIYKAPIAHQHYGFMVQCLNESPQFKDTSESIYRRQLFVPFIKCFTGAEHKHIKDDYLHRPEVLQYVLKRVLTMDYYELREPAACVLALDEVRNSDPVRAFWSDVKNVLAWDLVPYQFIYDLFKAWMERNHPSSKPIGRNKFMERLKAVIGADEGCAWELVEKPQRPKGMMSRPEPLIVEYDLEYWINDKAPKNDSNQRATVTNTAATYRGLLRKPGVAAQPAKVTVLSRERLDELNAVIAPAPNPVSGEEVPA